MKKLVFGLIVCITAGTLAACKSKDTVTIDGQRYSKKIYLTKEDYMEDLGNVAELDRRDLQPNKESDYIFNVVPQETEDVNVYFFNKRQEPKVPGEYSAQDYKGEKRLWTKPKRYTPEQYYGMQNAGSEANTETAAPTDTYESDAY